MIKAPQLPSISVLMATHDGAGTLRAQIDSILGQTVRPRWFLASDDGSTDGTCEILQEYADNQELTEFEGPCKGATENFLTLLAALPQDAEYAALSDQDDVWLPQKLERAARGLASLPDGQPALFCARALICNDDLSSCHAAPMPDRAPGFRHALVQNVAGGNCMVLNRAAIELVQSARSEAGEPPYHDWWIYQLISGAGGAILLDDVPTVKYRQHARNAVGSGHHGLGALLRRPFRVLSGSYGRTTQRHADALQRSAHRLTPENRALLADFIAARRAAPLDRLRRLRQLGVYRQGRAGTFMLWCAAILGRV